MIMSAEDARKTITALSNEDIIKLTDFIRVCEDCKCIIVGAKTMKRCRCCARKRVLMKMSECNKSVPYEHDKYITSGRMKRVSGIG